MVFGSGAAAAWIAVAVAPRSVFTSLLAAASVLSVMGAGGLYMCFALVNGWPTLRRLHFRRRSEDQIPASGEPTSVPDPKTTILTSTLDLSDRDVRELGAILGTRIPDLSKDTVIPDLSEPESPGLLEIKLEDQEWKLFQGLIWIVSLKIRLTNTSEDRVIPLKQFSLESEPASKKRRKPTEAQASAVLMEIMRLRDSCGSPLRAIDLPPRDSMSGWYVDWASLPADGGRPHCTFTVTDAADDNYELGIQARPRQVYRMPGGESHG